MGIIHVKIFKVNNCFSDLNCHGTDVKSILKVGWKGLMPFITFQRGRGGEALYNSILLSPFQLDFYLCASASAQRAAEPEPGFQQNGSS